MSQSGSFEINTEMDSLHLSRSPLIEAVLDFRARANENWESEKEATRDRLRQVFPEYADVKAQREVKFHFKVGQSTETDQEEKWEGYRIESKEPRRIAIFGLEGFSFHWLKPYPSWTEFGREALRLWATFVELAKPSRIQRMGVRSINRIEVPAETPLVDSYFNAPPQGPLGLDFPITGFMYQELLHVPESAYEINIIRTLQSAQDAKSTEAGLILDIDVFTTEPIDEQEIPAMENSIRRRLDEMRRLKNRVFLASLKKEKMEDFR